MNQGKKVGLLGSPLRWAGVSMTLLSAPVSLAEDCPTPSLQQCVDVDYRSSKCGEAHDGHCQQIIETEWRARWDNAPKRTVLLPKEFGSGTATVATQPVSLGTTRVSGMDQGLSGQVLKGQILYRKKLENLTKTEQAYLAQLQAWDKNGTQVTSCQEYVDEKYYDYSRFERRSGVHGDDYRALFQSAYETEGIAHRTLYSRDGKKLAPIWGETRVAKNAYFAFTPGPYPKGFKPYEFTTDAARLANNPEARQWAVASDSWHQEMAEQLAHIPDDELTVRQEEQEGFIALLAQRAGIYADWQKAYALFLKKDRDTKELNATTAERLYALDKAIEERLVQAEGQGCLDSKYVTSCDWSPRRYKLELDAAMGPRRAADLQACLFLTGNDFSETSFVRNAHLLKISTLKEKDYTLNTTMLAQYVLAYGQYIQAQAAPTNPSTGLVRHGGEAGDSGYAGDNFMGAGYDYNAGWEVTAPAASSARMQAKGFGLTGPWCEYNARIYGEFNAYANLFSPTRMEVIHIDGSAGTEGNGIRLTVGARFLGQSVYTHDQTHPLRVTFAQTKPVYAFDEAQTSYTFMVWYIPVTLTAGVSAETGVKFDIGGAITRDCAADLLGVDLFGILTPYLSVNGFASVGIGLPKVQVAVRGTVVLTRANLPLETDIGIYLSSPSHPTDPNTLFLRLTSKLDIETRFLDGRISLFAQLFDLKAEFPVFSWSGFGLKHNIYTETKTVPLARIF
ncbi:hypothetical protein SAMN05443572_106169 [Myxococcus fulvus]|uniref:Lipoprotein n=2 Tax=Myxococcus fulvus TaxID=33 RepID=A0A511T2K8_MYXFU|nr:hypothetical protein MFU01_34430 [Myxococcus fulvus]SEU20672.1 hypothetical protein SAMN05443572_106169 [Myxococcus fulvus]